MILDEIVANKKIEVEKLKSDRMLPFKINKLIRPRDFMKAISRNGVRLIAEVKSSSPSAGTIVKDYDPAKIARQYERAGASAISVLTDNKYFNGSIDDLRKVKKAVNVPVLRKDFIIDESQLYESRIAGADAVLLIVRILSRDQLGRLIKTANNLSLTAVVEVHSLGEAELAMDAGAEVIGINNRDLDSLKVDIMTTVKIINSLLLLKDKVLISESGISDKKEVDMLKKLGVSAVLIGEAILKSPDIAAKIRELIG